MAVPINVQVGLPSGRSLSQWIKNATAVEVKLLTNDVLVGKLLWQDEECIGLDDSPRQGAQESAKTTLIWRSSIAYIRPRS